MKLTYRKGRRMIFGGQAASGMYVLADIRAPSPPQHDCDWLLDGYELSWGHDDDLNLRLCPYKVESIYDNDAWTVTLEQARREVEREREARGIADGSIPAKPLPKGLGRVYNPAEPYIPPIRMALLDQAIDFTITLKER